MSPVIFTFVKMQDPPPKNYESFVPLVHKWIDTQHGAYSLRVPEKHSLITEQSGEERRPTTPSPDDQQQSPKTVKHHLKQHEHRVMRKMTDKIDALTQQIHSIGAGKGKGPVMKNDGGWHWFPQPSASDVASHPVCVHCKGKHKKLGPKKCPSITQDS